MFKAKLAIAATFTALIIGSAAQAAPRSLFLTVHTNDGKVARHMFGALVDSRFAPNVSYWRHEIVSTASLNEPDEAGVIRPRVSNLQTWQYPAGPYGAEMFMSINDPDGNAIEIHDYFRGPANNGTPGTLAETECWPNRAANSRVTSVCFALVQ